MYKWILMIDKKITHPHSWQDYNSPHIEKANKIAIIETCQINALRPCFECKYFLLITSGHMYMYLSEKKSPQIKTKNYFQVKFSCQGQEKDFTIQSYLNELFFI